MSEKINTAVMEVIKAHMDGEDKNTKAVLSDVMESVNEILEQQPCDECRNKRTSICGNCKEYDEYEPCDDALIQLKKYTEGKQNTDKVEISVLTLNRIIKALSQEPTEKPMTVDEMEREYEKSKALFHKIVECEDAVSRMALGRSKMCEDIDCYNCPFWVIREGQRICRLSEYVKDLPSVTQKSGKWIDYQKNGWIYAQCSECGEVHDSPSVYCPSCGAKMVKPQESEDKE